MTEEEWRQRLTPEQYRVLREQETEPPFSHSYAFTEEEGVYRCAGCGAELFRSDAKFESGTGWPSFTDPAVADGVELRPDHSHGIGADRGGVREVRRAPGARVRRWSGPDRAALLHERGLPGPPAAHFGVAPPISGSFRPIGGGTPSS